MSRYSRVLGVVASFIGVSVISAVYLHAAQSPKPAAASNAARIAHGKYLVDGVAMCGDCHTPMTPQGPDMSRYLQGADLEFAPVHPIPNWAPHSARLAGGLQQYTVEGLAAALRGKRDAQGRPVPLFRPPMPAYQMNDADALAVATYVKSLK